MSHLVAEKQLEQNGMTFGCKDHDDEFIYGLVAHLKFLPQSARNAANADCDSTLHCLSRRQLRRQEQEDLEKITQHVAEGVE
jgi:hypothetical protein